MRLDENYQLFQKVETHIDQSKKCPLWSVLGQCYTVRRCSKYHFLADHPSSRIERNSKTYSFIPYLETIWKIRKLELEAKLLVKTLEDVQHKTIMMRKRFTTSAATGDVANREATNDSSCPVKDSQGSVPGPAHDRIVLLSCNMRGIQSKKKSVEVILAENEVDILVALEMNTKKCPKIKGYASFNHLVDKKFHGVSIFVSDSLAPSTMRIHDMSNNEMVHIRITSVTPALNVVGVYMDVEGREYQECQGI